MDINSYQAKKAVDLEKSRKFAELINAKSGRCHSNIGDIFLLFSSELPSQTKYIEGLWMVQGQPGLHAWIEIDDSIIDPTFVVSSNSTQRDNPRYYPIKKLTKKEINEKLEKESFFVGGVRELILTNDDPEVEELLHIIDPP